MSSAASSDGPGATTPATGKSRRWPARRIAVCAAIGIGALGCGAVGWWLQGAVQPAAATVLVDERQEHDSHAEAGTPSDDHGHAESHAVADDADGTPHAEDAGADHDGGEDGGHGHGPVAGARAATGTDGETANKAVAGAIVIPPTPEELVRAAEMGEQYLLEGSPTEALRVFDWILEHEDRALDDRFHYRCGVCAEALGEFDRALTEYGTALGCTHEKTLSVLCRLGQARVWRSLGHIEMGSQLLASAWLTNSESELSPVVRPFAAYLFADALVAENLVAKPPQLSEDDGLQYPAWKFDLFERPLLKSIRDEEPKHSPVASGVRVLSPGASGTVDVMVQARLPRMGLMNIVDALCRAAALRPVWSGEARQAVSGRSSEICIARGSLPLCLDALTSPLGIVWEQRGLEVRLSSAGEVDETVLETSRRKGARRALEHAVQEYPEFDLAPQALVALGNMAWQEGQSDEAERRYKEMLEKYPRSPIRADAWFNLAKLDLTRHRADAALESFWHVVDCGAPPASASVAYLYIGRLLLDGEQPRRAVTPLTRATQWATEGTIRTKAVLGLAAAHLLNGHPETANDVLMDFRSDVEAQSRLAAFVSALARYRAVSSPTRRLYEGQSLLAALDPVGTGDVFGRYGWYLRGRAYEELLLPEMAVDVYREALAAEEHPPYRDAMVYGLGSCLVDIGDVEGARLQFTGLMENSASEWQRKAAFRLCRLQLDGDEALAASRTARMLVDQCTTQQEKVQALELLGEAFQQMGDHAAAALCFAGTVPGEAPSTEMKEQ